MTLQWIVKGQRLYLKPHSLVAADSKNYLKAHFEFDSEWSGRAKTAVFEANGGEVYHMLLQGDSCLVPAEVIAAPGFTVSVFGGDRLTTQMVFVEVEPSGCLTGVTPPEPTPDIYDQLVEEVAEQAEQAKVYRVQAQESAEQAREHCEEAESHAQTAAASAQTAAAVTSAVVAEHAADTAAHAELFGGKLNLIRCDGDDADTLFEDGVYSGTFTNTPAAEGVLIVKKSGEYRTQTFIGYGDGFASLYHRPGTLQYYTSEWRRALDEWDLYAKSFEMLATDRKNIVGAINEVYYKVYDVAANVSSWADVQEMVRKGIHQQIFSIGDQLVCRKGSDTLVWDVIGIDHDTPTDKTKEHSLTLQLHDCSEGVQFDAKEALFYAENEIPAGTYCFTVTEHPWVSSDVGKTFHFTLAKPVPAGGQIVLNAAHTATIGGSTVTTYESATSGAEIETATVATGSAGSLLGTVNYSIHENVNSIQRALLGNNRYSQSAIRQYLNSEEAANSWWTPQNIFDRPPTQISSAGFLNGMDEDFLSVIGEVDKVTSLDTVPDGGGSETTAEKFFLLSRTEVYGGNENGISEGAAYPYYANNSDLSSAGMEADTNRIKYRNGIAQLWWLRSPNTSYFNYAYGVYTSGNVGPYGAINGHAVATACCIV